MFHWCQMANLMTSKIIDCSWLGHFWDSKSPFEMAPSISTFSAGKCLVHFGSISLHSKDCPDHNEMPFLRSMWTRPTTTTALTPRRVYSARHVVQKLAHKQRTFRLHLQPPHDELVRVATWPIWLFFYASVSGCLNSCCSAAQDNRRGHSELRHFNRVVQLSGRRKLLATAFHLSPWRD